MTDATSDDGEQMLPGDALPDVRTDIPGPEAIEWIDEVSRTECPAITARRARREDETGIEQDPLVWKRAREGNVEDVDGNRYVDLTSAFAVAGLGHNPPCIVEAARDQLDDLIHAMGDVYPAETKVRFCRRLAEAVPGDLQQSILGLSGSDAVQAALKTATIHTDQPGAIAFWGGCHGMAYGALSATAYRSAFREPFLAQLNRHIIHVPYPNPLCPPFGLDSGTEPGHVLEACLDHVRAIPERPDAGHEGIGAIIVEPIQGRGGEVVPQEGFLRGLRAICDDHDLVLIFDEIYTEWGRTGERFACQHEGVTPDVMCVGKAMGGGFPLSAAVGRPEVMRSWELSGGEAIHIQTFLGNPLGCAMAEAAVDEIVESHWPERVAEQGNWLESRLLELQRRHPNHIGDVRERGLMWGLELVRDMPRSVRAGSESQGTER